MCSSGRDAGDFPFMCERVVTPRERSGQQQYPKIKEKKRKLETRLPDYLITYYQTVFWDVI